MFAATTVTSVKQRVVMLVGRLVNHFDPDSDILTTTGRIKTID